MGSLRIVQLICVAIVLFFCKSHGAGSRHSVSVRSRSRSTATSRRPWSLSGLAMDILKEDEHRIHALRTQTMLPTTMHGTRLVHRALIEDSGQAPVVSGRSIGSGNYVVQVGLGTPSKDLLLILDTGSFVAWTQCLPCESNGSCYSQAQPIFDPSQSSSYAQIPCDSTTCTLLNSTQNTGCSATNTCVYSLLYGDNSTTTGDLASDTLTLGNVTLNNFTFGCGHDNEGLFQGVDGLLGLGQGPLGFPGQSISMLGGVFSYCLPSILSPNSSGFIEFGSNAISASRSSSTFTPLINNLVAPSFYFVWLQGISVGTTSLPIYIPNLPPTTTVDGATIVDSGTVITRLSKSYYSVVRDYFRNATQNLPAVQLPANMLFDTCYNLSSSTNVTIPELTFHFFNGLDFIIPADNLLIPVDDAGTACFAFAELPGNFTIIGNYQQQGYRFTYDTVVSALGIQQTKAC